MATILNTVYLNGCNYQIAYDLLGQDIANNYSSVRFYGILNVTNNYVAWSRGTAQVWDAVSTLSTRYNKGSYVVVQKDVTINHNADGTQSVTVTGSLNTTFTSGNTQAQLTLPTIPRASYIGNQTGTINNEMTISWNRATSSFTHTLHCKFGDYDKDLGTNLQTDVKWTPPKELYKYIKTSKTGTGILTLTTYNGSNYIGVSTSTITLNSKESDSIPVLNSYNIKDTNNKTIALTNDDEIIVLYNSNAKCDINFTIREYATLKKVTINGVDVTSNAIKSESSTDDTLIYNLSYTINAINTNIVNISITDSRDYVLNKQITLSKIVNYIPLTANLKAYRSQPTTGEIVTEFSGNYYNGKFNETSNESKISYAYKKQNEEEFSEKILITNYKIDNNLFESGENGEAITLGTVYDYREVYDFIFYYEDKLTSLQINITVNKGIPVIWWNNNSFNSNVKFNANEGFNLTTYDEYEETPCGTWIDGKTIYRKVLLSESEEDYQTVETGINNMEWLVHAYGTAKMTGDTIFLPLMFANTGGMNSFHLIKNGAELIYQRDENYTTIKAYFILEYTKRS